MKVSLHLSRKKLYILISLVVVFCLFLGLGTYLLLNKGTVDRYASLSSYCDVVSEGEERTINCKAIMSDLRAEGEESCVDVILLSSDAVEKSVEICGATEKLTWENPYGNYDRYIPVNVVVSTSQGYLLESIVVTLMEDKDALDFLKNFDNESFVSRNVRIKSNEEINAKGFYLTEKDGKKEIVFKDVIILKKDVKDGKIWFDLDIRLYDERYRAEITSSGFDYLREDDGDFRLTSIAPNNLQSFAIEGNFQLVLSREDIDLQTFVDQTLSSGVMSLDLFVVNVLLEYE